METGQWIVAFVPLGASAIVGGVGWCVKRAIDRLVETLRELTRKVYEHETRLAVHGERLDGHGQQLVDVRGRLERAGA